MVNSWGPSLAPSVYAWLQGNPTRGESRNFACTLVPALLYAALTPDRDLARLSLDSAYTQSHKGKTPSIHKG